MSASAAAVEEQEQQDTTEDQVQVVDRTPVQDAAHKLHDAILSEWMFHLLRLDSELLFDRTDYDGTASHNPMTDDSVDTGVLWLPCSIHRDGITLEHLHRACEGLALLAMLSTLDAPLWRATIETVWPLFECRIYSPPSLNEVMKSVRSFGLSISIATVEHVEWISERLVGVEPMSSTFQETVAAIESMLFVNETTLAAVVRRAYPPRIPVVVYFETANGRDDHRHRVFRQLLQIAITQHRYIQQTPVDREASAGSSDSSVEWTCFTLIGVGVFGDGATRLVSSEIDYLCRIAELGVRIVKVPSFSLAGMSTQSQIDSLRVLFPPEAGSRRVFGADEVDILDSSPSALTIPLLSALQVSQSMNCVFLKIHYDPREMDPHERFHRRGLWRWIAYALFSRHARHRIRNLVVRARNLRATDLDQLRQVVEASNPLSVLFGVEPCAHCDFIAASRFALEKYPRTLRDRVDSDLAGRDEFTNVAPIVVRVIQCPQETHSAWWSVLLPGRGQAWVHQRDVTVVAGDETRPPDAIPSIELVMFADMTNSTKHACVSFLEALPCRIKSVEFTSNHDYVEVDDWYPAVLAACPGLTRLFLPVSNGIDTLETFLPLAVEGTCTLEILVVGPFVRLQYCGLLEFLQALADGTHPLTRGLRELELNLIWDDNDDGNDEPAHAFIAAMQTMLDHNRRLPTIRIVFDNFDDTYEFKWRNEDVAIPTGPLALRRKLALLSVVIAHSPPLDSSVLTIVFQFAAPHRVRHVVTY